MLENKNLPIWLSFGIATFAICFALFYEHILNYQPCALCYEERIPYYVFIPLSLLFLQFGQKYIRYFLALAILLMLYSAGFGAYHAGVEWLFWPGPESCSGAATTDANIDLLTLVETVKIVPCDQANWRLFGISFAGYNALTSLFIVGLLVRAFVLRKKS